MLIPLPDLPARASEVPKGERVYLIGASGRRSLVAAEAPNQAGWDTVSVTGRTKGWLAAGPPVRQGSGS